MTTWTISIIPTTNDFGNASDAIWLISSEFKTFGVPNGKAFPPMSEGDTIQFQAPKNSARFLKFDYSVLQYPPETAVFRFQSGQRRSVMPGVAIEWDDSADNTFTVHNLPENDGQRVLLHVQWSVINEGRGNDEGSGTLTGKLSGSAGEPPNGSQSEPNSLPAKGQ